MKKYVYFIYAVIQSSRSFPVFFNYEYKTNSEIKNISELDSFCKYYAEDLQERAKREDRFLSKDTFVTIVNYKLLREEDA